MMSTWNTGHWNDGRVWNQALPIKNKYIHMKVKTNTGRSTDAQAIQLGTTVGTNATGKPEFASTPMLPADLLALVTTASTARNNEVEAEAARAAAREARVVAMTALRAGINEFAMVAELVYDGDGELLLALGFELRRPSQPVGPLPAPGNLRAVEGALTGTAGVEWEPLASGQPQYFLECATSFNGPYTPAYTGRTARAICPGLTPGAEYFFRVRAHGAAGFSPWSDVAQAHAAW